MAVMSGTVRGALLILIAYLLMTAETVVIHAVGDVVTPLQFILTRNLGCLGLIGLMAWRAGGLRLSTEVPGLQIVRAGLTMVSLWCLFYGFAILPLADATAVTYTRAVFVVVLASLVLGERFSRQRLLAVVAGVVGGLIVIRPVFSEWHPAYLVILAGAVLNAGSMVATKALERRDSTLTILAWLTGISTILCLPALSSPWPIAAHWPSLLMVAVFGSTGLWFGLLAIRAADLSVLAPFDYSRLIMAAAFGFFLFREVPDIWAFVGALIIIGACASVTWPLRRKTSIRPTDLRHEIDAEPGRP
jgi:drug/metabolite transporter (DMT)-like permease